MLWQLKPLFCQRVLKVKFKLMLHAYVVLVLIEYQTADTN